MSRRLLRLGPLVALLLLLQWGTAFAHCLGGLGGQGGSQGLAVEICTADGLRTLHVGEDGQPEAPAQHDSCPVCQSGAALEPPAPRLPNAPVIYARLLPPQPAGMPTAPARAPPQQPRAPPIA